ncbi:MAG: hypothetical protein ACJARS_003295 [bacterium]|jgi:hypothetical protein
MNLAAQNTANGVTASGTVGNAQATGLAARNVSMDSAYLRDGGFDLRRRTDGTGEVDVNATRADVNQLQVKGTTVESVGVDRFRTTQRGKNDASYSAGRVRASGINAEGTTVASLDGRGVSVDAGNGEVTAGMSSLSAADIRSGEHAVGGVELTGGNFSSSKDAMSGSLDSGSVSGVRTNIGGRALSVNDVAIQQAAFDRQGQTMAGSLNALSVGGASYDGTTVNSASISGVRGTHGPNASAGSIDNVAIGGVRSGDNAVTSVNAKGLTVGKNGEVINVGADGLDASGISTANGTIRSASVVGASGSHGPDNSHVSVNAASATGIDMGQHGAGAVWASGLSGERDAKGMRGGIETMRGVQLRTGGTSVGEVNASGMSGVREGESTHLGLSSLDATQIAHRGDGLSANVNSLGVRGAAANIGPDGLTAGASEVTARGLSGRGVSKSDGSGGGGMNPDMIRALGGAVQDADIRASIPMNSGKYGDGIGRVNVKDGTQMDANVAIRDGQMVPGAARADFSQNLGGPAWVGVRGAYLDEQARLKADLAGAPNINLGKSMGLGRNIDTSLASHVNSAADTMAAGPKTGPRSSNLGDSFDMANANMSADVRLGNGTVDLGDGNSVALAGENQTDNVVSVNKASQEDLVMTFTRFLTSSLRLGAGGSSVSADSAAVEQGQVSMDQKAEEGTAIEGTVGAITLKNVGVTK